MFERLLAICIICFIGACSATAPTQVDKDLKVSVTEQGDTYTLKICQRYTDLDEAQVKEHMTSLIQSRTDSIEREDLIKEYDKHFTPSFRQEVAASAMKFFDGSWLLEGQEVSDTISIKDGHNTAGYLSFFNPNLLVMPYDGVSVALEFQSMEPPVLVGMLRGKEVLLSKLN